MKLETLRFTEFQGLRSVLTLLIVAILAGCSSQRSPDCNDPSVISAIERNVNQIVESELSAGITEPTLLASARKVFQLHVEGIRTTSTDADSKKAICTGILIASLNPSGDKSDNQTSLRNLAKNLGVADAVQVNGGELRTEIHFAAVNAADTNALTVGLSEHNPLVHRLATVARLISPESGLRLA